MNSALFVRDAIFPHCTLVHVASHSYSRDKTRKTKWVDSQGTNATRTSKTVRKREARLAFNGVLCDSAANEESAIDKCTERL